MLRIRWQFCCLAILLPCSMLAAANDTWDSIVAEYDQAIENWNAEMMKAQGDDKGKSGVIMIKNMASMPPHPSKKFRPRVRAYAELNTGKPTALPALRWLVRENFSISGLSSDGGAGQWALKRLAEDHATDPNVLSGLDRLSMVAMSVGEEPLVAFLETVSKKNPDRKTRGQAKFGMAEVLFEGSPMMRMMGIGSKSNRTAQKKRAETILRELVKEYAGDEIAKKANELLFVIDHLQVGMTAPQTVGKDVDGKEIRLSDFRGRVVIMVYWATWCAPCMQMIPHERELVEKYKGKPFTLLGINGDQKRSTLRKAIKEHNISWPTIHDGMPGLGPIASKWRVRSFPTFVLIDPKGVIRQIGPMLYQMENKIDSLLANSDAH